MWSEFFHRLGDPARRNPQAVLAILIVWACIALYIHWLSPGSDLWALYVAGHFIAEGQPDLVYASPDGFFGGTAPEWGAVVAALDLPSDTAFPYIYPPIWAWIMSWVTPHISPQAFGRAFLIVNIALCALSVLIAARLVRPVRLSLPLWCVAAGALLLFSVFSYAALFFNQPQIVVTFLILLAFERLLAGADKSAGALLALGAAMKIMPGVFVIIMLAERRWRAAGSFALTGIALLAASILLAGPDLHRDFLAALSKVSGKLAAVPVNGSAQLVATFVLHQWGVLTSVDISNREILTQLNTPSLPLINWGARFCLVALTASFFLRVRPLPLQKRIALSVLVLSILLPLFSPIGWLHYYLLPVMMLPVLLDRWYSLRSAAIFAALLTLLSFELFFSTIVDFGLLWPIANSVLVIFWGAVLATLWWIAGEAAPLRGSA